MFYDCKSLTTLNLGNLSSALSGVTDMTDMFRGCSSLTDIDLSYADLSSVTIMDSTFRGCTNLKTIDLRGCNLSNVAETRYLFGSCSSLESIYIGSQSDTEPISIMLTTLSGTPDTMKIYVPYQLVDAYKSATFWKLHKDQIVGWGAPYLCFTANEAGSTISMSVNGRSTVVHNFQYSTDAYTWNEFEVGTTEITLANKGDEVWFKGNNPNGIGESEGVYYHFVMTGSISASGNIMSLIDDGACTTTTISNEYCYLSIFQECVSLTTAPELPATTLASYCYYQMFAGCTSLITAPELPATTLADYCYGRMFAGCTSLIVSDTSGEGYDKEWRVPTSGTFTNTYVQSYMFANCKGTRSSDDMAGEEGQFYTYYTQNNPV